MAGSGAVARPPVSAARVEDRHRPAVVAAGRDVRGASRRRAGRRGVAAGRGGYDHRRPPTALVMIVTAPRYTARDNRQGAPATVGAAPGRGPRGGTSWTPESLQAVSAGPSPNTYTR